MHRLYIIVWVWVWVSLWAWVCGGGYVTAQLFGSCCCSVFAICRWRHASSFHEAGVLNDTISFWVNGLPQEVESAKFLAQYISGAFEFRDLATVRDAKALIDVGRQLDRLDRMHHSKFNLPHMVNSGVLLHAHLMQVSGPVTIPATLMPDVHTVLGETMRLMDAFIDLSISRQFATVVHKATELQQMIVQGLWLHDDPLLQVLAVGRGARAILAMSVSVPCEFSK